MSTLNVENLKHPSAASSSLTLASDGSVSFPSGGGGLIPVGTVFYFASSSAPTGFLKANGDTVPNGSGTVQSVTADFSALYAILGSTYGSAGQLPDLRGEFIRGWDDSKGTDSGRTFGSSQAAEFESHSHKVGARDSTVDYGSSSSIEFVANYPSPVGQYVTSDVTGGGETRPRNIALLACIKY